jgi:hypothetical protein
MRPVPPCAAARVGAAVPSALASLQGFHVPLSSAGLRSVSTPAARTCRRPQHLWSRTKGLDSRSRRRGSGRRALGAMTAALVIVPADPVRPASASAQRGRCPGSTVGPRKVQTGAPWMVRLSMGSADVMLRVTSSARLAPARKQLPGSRR